MNITRKSSFAIVLMVLFLYCFTRARAADFVFNGMPVHITTSSLKEARFATTIRQQYDFSCGSAALATLLSYHYGYPVNEKIIFDKMFRDGDQKKIRAHGFSLLDMQRYLAQQGFRADGFELQFERLLEAKLPAIVLISENGYNHFVVIKGLKNGRVLLGDPSSGTRAISIKRFQQIWQNKLLFVVHGFSGKASFNGDTEWVVAPEAPLGLGVNRETLANVTFSPSSPGNF